MSIVFLCCDLGETNALIPVMHELQQRKVDFKLMAMGAAINRLQSDASLKDKVIAIQETVDTANARAKPIENVATHIQGLQPLIVISGPASKAQEQLLKAIPAKHKVVYLDSFNYTPSHISFETVKGVANAAHDIICVTNIVKEQMLANKNSPLKERDIKPLGRPSVESWVRQVKGIDKASVLKKVGFDSAKKVVTIIGGYGPRYDAGVNAAFESAVKTLESAGFQVHVQHHPNVVKQQPLTTIEAVGIADAIVCYDSTVGFEALFADKRVIYLQPKSVEPYDNIAIQKKLADCVQTDEQLVTALQSSSVQAQNVYAALGVERNSTAAITHYVLKKLSETAMAVSPAGAAKPPQANVGAQIEELPDEDDFDVPEPQLHSPQDTADAESTPIPPKVQPQPKVPPHRQATGLPSGWTAPFTQAAPKPSNPELPDTPVQPFGG